ncbi:hypothetical protein HK405_005430 [Cladochytrium tenue]|nr:hypothetical protein HK405_005430 [Cladochytrium tenue]
MWALSKSSAATAVPAGLVLPTSSPSQAAVVVVIAARHTSRMRLHPHKRSSPGAAVRRRALASATSSSPPLSAADLARRRRLIAFGTSPPLPLSSPHNAGSLLDDLLRGMRPPSVAADGAMLMLPRPSVLPLLPLPLHDLAAIADPSAKPPRWSRQLNIAVPLYRTALFVSTNSLRRCRRVATLVSGTVSESVTVTPVSIPRRKGITIVDGSRISEADQEGEVPAEWVVHRPSFEAESERRKATGERERVIVYFHGHRYLAARLSETSGCRVLSVDYRLAPEHPFPLPLHDAICAHLWLADPLNTGPTDPDADGARNSAQPQAPGVVFAGDSAGGGLSIALALWARDRLPPHLQPLGVVAMAPWVDLTHSMPSFHLNTADYLPELMTDPAHLRPGNGRTHFYTTADDWNAHPYVSPLFASDRAPSPQSPAADGAKLPDGVRNVPTVPMLVQLGSRERLRDEGLALAARAFRRSPLRVELYEDMVHVFQAFAAYGEEMADRALASAGSFIRGLPDGSQGEPRPREPELFFVPHGGDPQRRGVDWADRILAASRAELDRRRRRDQKKQQKQRSPQQKRTEESATGAASLPQPWTLARVSLSAFGWSLPRAAVPQPPAAAGN